MKSVIHKQIIWIYVTVFINILSFGMVLPLLPLFAETFGASAFEIGILVAIFSVGQFFAAPIWGRLSDRYGRKPILLASIAITAVAFSLIGFAKTLTAVFLGRFLHGVASAGNYPVAVAYIADKTTKEERTLYVSRISAVFATAFMIGPLAGGILGEESFSLAFLGAAGVALLNFFSVVAFLPESLTERQERKILSEGLFNFRAIWHGLRSDFGVLFFLLFAWSFYVSNFQLAIPLFTQERFGAGAFENAIFFSATGLVAAISQWFIVPRAVRWFGEIRTILAGIVLMILGQIFVPLSPTLLFFYAYFMVSVLGSALQRPTVNARLSKTTAEGQGTTMGLAFSFESMGRFFGPLAAGLTIGRLGFASPFINAAGLLGIGAILFWKKERRRHG